MRREISRRNFIKNSTGFLAGYGLLQRNLYYSGSEMRKNPELIVDIDFNDEVIIRPEPMTEQQVVSLIRDLHSHGTDILLVRMGYLGYLPYHTKLSYPVGFDPIHARKYPFTRNPAELEKFIAERAVHNERYRKVLEDFNPPEIFVREGHKLGMKVIFWIDIFDDMYSGHRSKFIDEHPYCQWTARDGKTYFNGLISYAWPESRMFRVEQTRELLSLGVDGIHCSTSAHCRHHPNVQQNDYYGFEEPVVNEFRKRYGVDLRSATDFDHEAWHTVKGEFMNLLYSELAKECHKKGKEFWIGLQLGEYTHFSADPYFSDNVVVRYRNLWKDLVDNNIADTFIIGDYEICSSPDHNYWKAKGIRPEPGKDLFSWSADYYQPYCKGKTKLYLFSEWLPSETNALDLKLQQWAERVLKNGFDGIDIHEAANFENGPGDMMLLRRLKSRLEGKNVDQL